MVKLKNILKELGIGMIGVSDKPSKTDSLLFELGVEKVSQ